MVTFAGCRMNKLASVKVLFLDLFCGERDRFDVKQAASLISIIASTSTPYRVS